jgi:predicted transcriptional regulator YdeE
MEKISLAEIKLIGLSLGRKTTNENGQSAIDCGSHWQKFEAGKYADRIPNKTSDEVFAVYHVYDGDHTAPYSYFIGCKVDSNAVAPVGMNSLIIPKADYVKIIVKGIMPDCVANAWRDIWAGNLERTYRADFEIYDEGSKDWNAAEVGIYVGVN